MMFREIIILYGEYHTEHIRTLCEKMLQNVTASTGLCMFEWSSAECQNYLVNVLAMKCPFFENTMNWLTTSLSFSYFPLLLILLF